MNVPSIKKALKAGRPAWGAWITLGHPSIAEVMAGAGFDWLTVDMEHSAITVGEAQQLIHAAEAAGAAPFVRATVNEPAHIKRFLDMGARGIIVPMVMDAAQARAAVDAAYYPPQGKRGVGLARAQAYGFGFEEYEKRHRLETMVVVQIEHIRAVENAEEILSVPGVDAFIVGPYDLSGSLGVPGKFDHPRVREAVARVLRVARRLGVPAGFHTIPPSAQESRRLLKEGYRFLAVSLDTMFLGAACRSVLSDLRRR